MRKHLLNIMLLAATLFVAPAAQAATIGYSNGTMEKSNLFRMGSTKKQGMAMRLGAEKLKELKGCTISAIQTAFGTRNTTGKKAQLFIATSPDDTPLCSQEVTVSSAAKWLEFTLDKPYTITGEEGELYIGYTAEADTRYNPLSADFSSDTKGVSYAYKDGKWVDIYGTGYGCVSIRAITDNAPSITDAMLKTFSLNSYYKVGTAYQFAGQLLNFGNETITSLDVELSAGNGAPVKQSLTGLSIAPGTTYDITFPEYTASSFGYAKMTLNITAVNGIADADGSDNQGSAMAYFYPADMERTILLEGFTGQTCPNCPTGHSLINSFLKQTTENVAEIWHHIGYHPDHFTMAADDAYLLFYGSNVTSYYAPAAMVNRYTITTLASQPVMNFMDNGIALVTSASEHVATYRRPYVSLKLESTYDETTREANVKLTVYAHEDLPEGDNILNVALVQDDIKAYQYGGGDNYSHGMVFRGTLTDNAWGKLLPTDLHAGDSTVFETTYTLPETIFSDYWTEKTVGSMSGFTGATLDDVYIPTDAANTYLVAYVGAYGGPNNDSGHEVYNCAQVKLGQSHTQAGVTGIQAVSNNESAFAPMFRTDGRRIVVDGCDAYTIYNMSGQRMPANADLNSGVYVVRATSGNQTTVKKMLVK